MAAVSPHVTRRLCLAALVACAATLAARPVPAAPQQAAPRRVVSTVPAATEMIFAMGAGSRLIAIGSYDRYPPEAMALPRVGGLLDPNVERILSLKPDLVIVYETQTELEQQLAHASIPIFRYTQRDLAGIPDTMRAIGERLGARAAADAGASAIERQIASIKARVAGQRRPKTLLVFGREPGSLRRVEASGGYGFLHDLLEIAGGADLLGDMNRESVQMSTEMILTRAPEVIVELSYGAPLPAARLESERQVWNALPSVPAVKNNRVYQLFGDEFVVPGPRIVVAAERLARILHPEVFK